MNHPINKAAATLLFVPCASCTRKSIQASKQPSRTDPASVWNQSQRILFAVAHKVRRAIHLKLDGHGHAEVETEELVHDAFLAVMEALPRFHPATAQFTTFVYGLARRRMWLVARAGFYGLSPEQMHRLDTAKNAHHVTITRTAACGLPQRQQPTRKSGCLSAASLPSGIDCRVRIDVCLICTCRKVETTPRWPVVWVVRRRVCVAATLACSAASAQQFEPSSVRPAVPSAGPLSRRISVTSKRLPRFECPAACPQFSIRSSNFSIRPQFDSPPPMRCRQETHVAFGSSDPPQQVLGRDTSGVVAQCILVFTQKSVFSCHGLPISAKW